MDWRDKDPGLKEHRLYEWAERLSARKQSEFQIWKCYKEIKDNGGRVGEELRLQVVRRQKANALSLYYIICCIQIITQIPMQI